MNNINNTLNDTKNLSDNRQKPSGSPDKFTAIIRRMSEGELAETNCVWMNAQDIGKYFQAKNTEQPPFARIANRVYAIVAKSWVKPGEIAVSPVQYEEVSPVINNDDTVIVTPYRQDSEYQRDLSKAKFILQPQAVLNSEESSSVSKNILDVEDIKKYFLNHYTDQIFKEGQSIHCTINNREYNATFISGESKDTPRNKHYFSAIRGTTDLFFETVEWAPSILTEKKVPEFSPVFRFDVSVEGLDNYHDTTRPLIYNVEKFEKQVREALENKWLVPGMFIEFSLDEGVDVKVTLAETILPKKAAELQQKQPEYVKAYQLTEAAGLKFVSDNVDICAVKGSPLKPKRATFKITMLDSLPGTTVTQDHIRNWVDVKSLKKKVRDSLNIFCEDTKFYIDHQGYLYTLEVHSIDNENLIDSDPFNAKHWKLDKDTKILFNMNKNIDLNLVPDEKAHALESIKLKITPVSTVKTDEVLEIDEEKLEKAIRDFLPIQRAPNQCFTLDLGNDQVVDVKVADMGFKNSKYNGRIYPRLGKIVSDTSLDYDYSIYKIRMVHPPNVVRFKNGDPREAMEDLGLTGLSDHIIETVETLVYPLGELWEWAEKLNIKPPKGLLLYGPAGTGKTTFADGIGKLLGIPDSNIKKISAKDIHNKWVGESEKNLHKLFAPAIKAAQADSSERFIIFIDEVESLCENRKNSTGSYKKDIVGALLAEMDGFNKLTNVMVIGTTNDFERIDPAFLRPGRFSEHLEFPLPDAAGRKKILEYHTKELRENDHMEEDIDLDHYAAIANNFSGDHIKGLVWSAKTFNLRRLSKLKLKSEEIENHPDHRVSKEDFKLAFEKINKTLKNNQGSPPPDGMYS
jgi:ATP-dependent 26S proteasome regulatory subunit